MILNLPKRNFNSVKIHSGVQAFNSHEVTSGITGACRAYSWLLPQFPKHPNVLLTDPPGALLDKFVAAWNTVHHASSAGVAGPAELCRRRRCAGQRGCCLTPRYLRVGLTRSLTQQRMDGSAEYVPGHCWLYSATAFPAPSDQSKPRARAQQEVPISLSLWQSSKSEAQIHDSTELPSAPFHKSGALPNTSAPTPASVGSSKTLCPALSRRGSGHGCAGGARTRDRKCRSHLPSAWFGTRLWTWISSSTEYLLPQSFSGMLV